MNGSATTTAGIPPHTSPRPNLDRSNGPFAAFIFVGLLAAGLFSHVF